MGAGAIDMTGLRRRFADAGKIKVTPDDLAKADAMPVSPPKTAPGQTMLMQGLLKEAEQDIARLKEQLANATASASIELARLDEVEGRRRKLTPEAYEELKANLASHPLAQPIVVRRKADGRFEILAGHNRASIYRELGRLAIPAFVVEVEDASADKVAFFSNLLAPSLPDFEKYWNFKRLAEVSNLTHLELAEAAGLSRTHVYRIMRFDDLPEAAKELLQDAPDRLGSAAAEKLAALAQAGRAAEVTEAVRKLVADPEVTQDAAIAMAKPPVAQATATLEPKTIKKGKLNFCDISVRNNVVGIRFAKQVSAEDAQRWASRFAEFVKAELDKE